MNIRRPVQSIKVYNWLDIIQKHLLPATCILCNNPGHAGRDLCDICYQDLPRVVLCCQRCAESLETPSTWPMLCGRCLSHPPAYDRTYAPFIYQGVIRHWITTLKFGANYKNARLLGQLLAEHLHDTAEQPDCIIPIPLHPSRYRERGFNQAVILAREIARRFSIPLDFLTLKRLVFTAPQVNLGKDERSANVRGAFVVKNGEKIEGRKIILVDDVYTTGSTVKECTRALMMHGAAEVVVLTLARAV